MRTFLRRVGIGIFVLAYAAMLVMVSGCTGKRIDLYSPTTGAKLATYHNTTDSEIGGLEATFDPSTGAFTVKVKSSTQSASESNAAMWAAVTQLITKIPTSAP